MRRTCTIALAILATLILTSNSFAETYTLEKCIETALQNNYTVITAKNTLDASKWGVYSAYSEILPSVSISTNRSENKGYLEVNGAVIPTEKNTNYGGSFSLGQSYPGLGIHTIANMKLQTARKNSYFYGFIDAQNQLVLSVKEAYYNVIKTKMLVDVSDNAMKRGDEQLKIAQSRYDLGSASLSDVLKAKVLKSNAQLDLISAKNNYSVAKANLNYTMGVDVAIEIEIDEQYPQVAMEISFDEALNEALSKNPSYWQTAFGLSAAKAQQWMARTSFLPAISFSVSHSTHVDDFDNLFDFEKKNASYSFGVGLSFNIFNNLGDTYNLISANKNVNTAEENLIDQKNSVALQVQQAYLNLQMNEEALKVSQEAVSSAQEDWNIVKEKYNLGAATMLDILDAEVSYKQAQVNQVEAQFSYNIAVSSLENVMGR
jgi:outer membrane protein